MAGRQKVGQPSNSLNARIDLKLKRRLEDAARDSGRSLAQEVERRLAASFKDEIQGDLQTPTGTLIKSIRNAITLIENHVDGEWWSTPNNSTICEGAIIQIACRLARPLPGDRLHQNKLLVTAGADDLAEQEKLRAERLALGTAIGTLATEQAFEQRLERRGASNSASGRAAVIHSRPAKK